MRDEAAAVGIDGLDCRDADPEASACRQLWRSVLVETLKDAFAYARDSRAAKQVVLDRDQARTFLTGSNTWLVETCDLAGVDAERLRAAARAWSAEGWPIATLRAALQAIEPRRTAYQQERYRGRRHHRVGGSLAGAVHV